ncbi:PQQ-binding-like beta-propeller repeat protein [Flavobacterium poyangense]|uniref:PQQ-binding-like beta-propeller repeat protein n=1 Tax=Flavobacterium poyangense TaxID=2204302 RepID=UPI00141E7568|nr:PQQ-binding-like beta-propeller repeat protein [Flavobacterium sp. JXAS1]
MNILSKKQCLGCLIFSLFLIVATPNLFAQSKYTVLLPTIDKAIPGESNNNLRVAGDEKGIETTKSFFKFDINPLPINAKVAEVNLKLYTIFNAAISDFSVQTITLLRGDNLWTGDETSLANPALKWANINENAEGPIGRAEVKKKTTSITMKLKFPESLSYVSNLPGGGVLSLAARSPEKGQSTQFFSTITAATPSNFSKKPKLLVSYEVDPYPFREDWAQPFANAQHNSLLNWSTNTSIVTAQARALPNTGNEYMQDIGNRGALLIYKNQPIVFTLTTTGTNSAFYVKQLDSKGTILWSTEVDGPAKTCPLIDEKGLLYYISTAGILTMIDLKNPNSTLNPPKKMKLTDITNNQITVLSNDVVTSAILGYDRTLYLSSDTSTLALSAYPEFQIRWNYELRNNETNGPVSLSADERRAFLINVDKQQKKGRLLVLDNFDGSVIAASDYVLGGYQDGTNSFIPAPIVQNDSTVFVLNGFDRSSKLFVFDTDNKEGILVKKSIESGATVNDGISQPAIDAKSNVFFVYNNKLAKYDPQENKVVPFDKSDTLDNGSILVCDASSDIYANDPYGTTKRVLGFKNDSEDPNSFSVGFSSDSEYTKRNLILAPDGTLYTVTAKDLIAITAVKVGINDVTIAASDLKTNTLYRASNTITVDGSRVSKMIDTILNSGGTIGFKPGFSWITGAKLTCKTGH